MQITSIRNQDNRTNFNGWMKAKAFSRSTHTDSIMDGEILDAIAKILPTQIKSKSDDAETLVKKIFLEDGTHITFDGLNSSLKVEHKDSRGLLDQHSCCSWETTYGDAAALGTTSQLDKAKLAIFKFFGVNPSK